MIINDAVARQAAAYLRQADRLLQPVIDRVGPCTIRPHTDYYQELVDSIISQQLSVQAARSIEIRFCGLFGGKFPTAGQILTKDVETLRSIGFSYAKARYVLDLAEHVVAGKIRFEDLPQLSNQAIITELTAVKGIGVWTAHMFLMFCMGRTDVLPTGDLGIRNGVSRLYGLTDAPTPQQVSEMAARNHWHPYESIASWYIWQALDNKPAV